MPKLDVADYIEKSGIRKARFGGYEPEDVRTAIQGLCNDYEQRLAQAETAARRLASENEALEQHCRAVTAQNRRLSAQGAALAGTSEKFSRQKEDLETQVASLRERNHSLSDQNAVLRLKNRDLEKENAALKKTAEQAQDELRVKGRELDDEKAGLAASRRQLLSDAEQEAAALVAEAERRAKQMEADAVLRAEAMDRLAREQGRRQAQRLLDAAADEANEIVNAHQLRLNNLRDEVLGMEARRDELIAYLAKVGSELLEIEAALKEGPKPEDAPPPRPEEPAAPLLPAVQPPRAELDLTPAAIARAAGALRAEAAQSAVRPAPAQAAPQQAEPARPAITLVEEPAPAPPPEPEQSRQTGPALTEVPGAIFSSPIVRQESDPILDETPPASTPRRPILPMLEDEEEPQPEQPPQPEGIDVTPGAAQQPPAGEARAVPDSPRRRKAVRAVRALQRMQRRNR